MKILIVDADLSLCQTLRAQLMEQRYIVDIASDGEMGWNFACSIDYDLIVLDAVLPKLDGLQLCRKLRSHNPQALILLLSQQGSSADKIAGLEAGADDYVVKPIAFPELEARIRALRRRQAPAAALVLECGELRFDLSTCEVTYAKQPLTLTSKEYGLLELFLRNPQRVFSQNSILQQLWSMQGDLPGEETVRAHVKRLRQKLRTVGADDLIETVYGLGYRFNSKFAQPQSSADVVVDQEHSTELVKHHLRDRVAKLEAKVLVVDDDVILLKLLKKILEPWGLEITTLSDPRQFWETLEGVQPDLIILDVQMPEVDGIELCHQVRDHDRWLWLPILFLTGQRDSQTVQKIFLAGADDYVNKPVLAPELIARLFNRLERNRLLRR